mmetsp:Transcript_57060/g.170086  ORF Transcript_57060/g.170086 Transcript_57060/m.170086 type:complete len:86 (+) Transcript_57060:13-270(+)
MPRNAEKSVKEERNYWACRYESEDATPNKQRAYTPRQGDFLKIKAFRLKTLTSLQEQHLHQIVEASHLLRSIQTFGLTIIFLNKD